VRSFRQLAEIIPRGGVGGSADHNQAIRLAPFLIVAPEVVRPVLEGHQHFIAARRSGGAGAAQQRIVEWIDVFPVLPRSADQHDRQRPRAASAQARGVLVHLVVQLARRLGHAQPRRFADRGIARQCAADRGLADPAASATSNDVMRGGRFAVPVIVCMPPVCRPSAERVLRGP
jgi:hypothetical protein